MDYVNSPAIKYVYRIKGLNDQWIELGNNRSASLVNVPAGDYLFQVKSTNADGVWVDNVASLSVHIDPVFGETVWAVLLYITMAVVIMLVVICIVLRITNLQRRIDFEQQISNLKLRFFTDISHELRTPLTLIASPIDEVISNEKLSDAGMENMQVAKRNTDRMLRLINQILDFRKIQNDKMKVLVEQVDIIPLILKSTVILFLWLIRIVLISGCFVLSIPLLCIRMWTNWRRFFLIYCPMPLNILLMRKVSPYLLLARNRFCVCR